MTLPQLPASLPRPILESIDKFKQVIKTVKKIKHYSNLNAALAE